MPRVSTLYLFSYNTLQAIGWAAALSRIISHSASTKSISRAYASAGYLVCLLQTVAFLEVLHGAIGIVPSGVLLPLMQWGGRTHFVLAIVRQIHKVQELPAVFIAFVAWSIGEVIRYSHYACNCVGYCPYALTYLRYTAFILVYPVGLGLGEIWLMYQALPFIKEENLYGNFFNKLGIRAAYLLPLLVAKTVCAPVQTAADEIEENPRKEALMVKMMHQILDLFPTLQMIYGDSAQPEGFMSLMKDASFWIFKDVSAFIAYFHISLDAYFTSGNSSS